MADPAIPPTPSAPNPAGGGALFDLGSHVVSVARFLLGPIVSVNGATATIHSRRPDAGGLRARCEAGRGRRPGRLPRRVRVRNHRHHRGQLGGGGPQDAARLRGGGDAGIDRVHPGADERAPSLSGRWCRGGAAGSSASRQARTTRPTGSSAPRPATSSGTTSSRSSRWRSSSTRTAGGPPAYPDFEEGYEVQRTVDAALVSARERRWVDVASV